MNIEPKDIKRIIFVPKDFFNDENLLSRIQIEILNIRKNINIKSQSESKDELNSFYKLCLINIKNERIILNVHLLMFNALIDYANKFNSSETLERVIKAIETPELKGKLSSKFPVQLKLLYAQVLFHLYELENRKFIGEFTKNRTELLLKSKYYLLKIYTLHLESKIVLTDSDFTNCLLYLSGCLSQLSRWFEPLYYLGITNVKNNPNIDYLYALNLDAIKNKTCLDYNGLLILKIIDKCLSVKKNPISHISQVSQLKEVEKENRKLIKKYQLDIKQLRIHKKETTKSFKNHNNYKSFCLKNHLFLNEHSFFCDCNSATKDNLVIETNHNHTQIDWVKNFEDIIDTITFDFINARYNYYKSLDSVHLNGFYVNEIDRIDSKLKLKNSFLKNSFKICYSILDQIAHGILQALDIDYNSILLDKYKEQQKVPKIYFFNIWDEPLFENSHFQNNFYLISLYSIAKDLDKTKISALKEFKQIRNAMEHKILKITDNPINDLKNGEYNRNELIDKTKLLLLLTKSSILSFNNLIRLQSKSASR